MRPTLVELGLPIEEEVSLRRQGVEIGESFKEMPFAELIQNIEQSVKNIYLPQYEELEALVTEEDTEYFKLARFMGDHERALLLSTENINNNSNEPMKPVTEMLRFPILLKKENFSNQGKKIHEYNGILVNNDSKRRKGLMFRKNKLSDN